jgi:hypothetical protein
LRITFFDEHDQPLPAIRSDKKRFDTAPHVKVLYVSYVPCHNCHVRTLNWPWVWSMYPKVDNGGLKVEPAWGGTFTENTRLSAYFERRVE